VKVVIKMPPKNIINLKSLDGKLTLSMSIFILILSMLSLVLWLTGPSNLPEIRQFLDTNPMVFTGFIFLAISIITVRTSMRTPSLILAVLLILLQMSGNCKCIQGLLNLHLPATCTITSTIITAYAVAIILFTGRYYSAAQIITYTAGTVAYASFLSSITGITEILPHFRVCITSSAMMVFGAVGLLSTHPSKGVVEPIYSYKIGGYTSRILIPIIISAVTITSFIIISSRRYLPFSAEVFIATLNLALIIIIITFTAYRLNRVDAERIKNQKRMERTWEFFRKVVENLEEAVAVLDKNGEPLHRNTAMKNLKVNLNELWKENLKNKNLPQPIHTFKIEDRYFTGWAIPLDEGGIISLMDVTRLIEIQKDLRANIAEKEALLRELHHRVKNNLQIITSLINIQLHDADEKAQEALLAILTRVKAMAIIQESIYSAETYTMVNMRSCVSRLTEHLRSLFNAHNINFHIRTDLKLNLETAMPLCLIINELVTNSIKHAFPENKGNVHIEVEEKDLEYHLRVADDGVGLRDKEEGTGLSLVKSLAQQLEGELRILTREDRGTEVIIPFKELEYKKRR